MVKKDKTAFESYWEDISVFIKYGMMNDDDFYQKVKDIIENYQPEQLSDDLLAKLEEIAADATSEDTLAVGKTSKAKRRRKFRAM